MKTTPAETASPALPTRQRSILTAGLASPIPFPLNRYLRLIEGEGGGSGEAGGEGGSTAGQGTGTGTGTATGTSSTTDDGKLPDDHPLVKAYRNTKADLADVRSKRAADRDELDRLRREKLPPEEQVIEDAKAEGRREAAMEAAQDLAAARIETALTGLVDDPAVIVEDLNLAKFITDDGKVDTDKVAALKAKYDGLKPTNKPADLGQGKRPTGEVTPSVAAGRDLFADRKKKK